jgi:hypothetical protein
MPGRTDPKILILISTSRKCFLKQCGHYAPTLISISKQVRDPRTLVESSAGKSNRRGYSLHPYRLETGDSTLCSFLSPVQFVCSFNKPKLFRRF